MFSATVIFLKSALSFSLGRCLHTLRDLRRDRTGNVAIVVALSLVPMLVAVGASFDYIRAYNVRQRMQSDLDAALIAAVSTASASGAEIDSARPRRSNRFPPAGSLSSR